MKKTILIVSAITLMASANNILAQAPNLGSTAGFELFTTVGAVTNSGISQVTGHVGSNSGSSTGFGNVNGNMNDQNAASALAATDLLGAYNQLNANIPNFFPAPLLGNGQILVPGTYSISSSATINLNLILDGQNNANAVFVFQISGALSTNASSKVLLINGAKACNVFWKVEGLVSMAPGTKMRGTVIANNAAINITAGDTLEGRALAINGAVGINNVLAYTPIGCGSPMLTGPASPTLASTACFALFTTNGAMTNSGISFVTGDIGTNVGLTTGFTATNVTGAIHPIPDATTAACATDLLSLYTYLNTLPYDIELLYPAQFGSNLVLTPHTYLMNGAVTFVDSLYLNGLGNPNAVFVIQVNGALSTGVNARVKLINGTQSKNVFWKIDGAVSIGDNSIFRGTIVANNGAVGLNTGVILDGRALTTSGAFTTAAINAVKPTACGSSGIYSVNSSKEVAAVYPNPFNGSITVRLNDLSQTGITEFKIYNYLGTQLVSTKISKQITTLETNDLPTGIYFYKVLENDKIVQSGKLISNQ